MSRQQQAVEQARKAFQTGRSKELAYRINQLKNLRRLLSEKQADIVDALKNDLYKVGAHVEIQHENHLCYVLCIASIVA